MARPDGLCVRTAVLRSVRQDVREVDFCCSTDTVDSYGEVVRQNWNLKRFASNPVGLFAHKANELPVGQWLNVGVDKGELVATFRAATEKANPLAENVWQSILEGTLRTVSVGFWPHKVSVEEIAGVERIVLDDNELFEISIVPIPANPDAIGKMKAKAIEAFHAAKGLHGCGLCGSREHLDRACPTLVVELGAVTYEATPPSDAGSWDSGNALKRIRRWATSDGSGDVEHINWNQYKRAFAWYDTKRSHEVGGYKLPHHDVKSGKLVTVRGGVIAAGNALQGSRGGVKIPGRRRRRRMKGAPRHALSPVRPHPSLGGRQERLGALARPSQGNDHVQEGRRR